MMPTKRPLETNRCGTHAPVWMKGEHPTSIQGAVRRTACAFWEGEECHWSWTIHVMACPAGYYVYKLPKPTICHAAYCTTVPLDEDAEGSGESEGSGDMTYTRRGDTQYKIYTESKTYDAAKKTCAADGGHLAVIKTEAVYNFLLGMIRDADVNKDYWIGLNDKAVENSWTWADGEPLNDGGFTKWAPGEPNNAEGIQDCGQLWAAKDFRWDDDRCYNAKYFICQI
ncbi:PREDICTED: C-type lectin-like, partial [Branchiostoma belcheri]|uniref:C-type lectin-like n=1 Tax=Branchiostoma belcheri TaxID=7741 RepID=A0A6P4Y3R6_BRABE